MDLRASVEDAEDAAAGFTTFRAPVPEHAAEVTALISDLYAISASFTSLDAFSKNPQYQPNWAYAWHDVDLVRQSFKFTIEDMFKYFYRLDNGNNTPENYKRVWQSLNRFFQDESRHPLAIRLGRYKTFLKGLEGNILANRSHDHTRLESPRSAMRSLLALQESSRMPPAPAPVPDNLHQGLGTLALGGYTVHDEDEEPFEEFRRETRGSRQSRDRKPTLRPLSRPHSRARIVEPMSPISPVSDRDRRHRRSFERPRPPHLSQAPLSPSSGTGTFSDSIPPSAPDAPPTPLTGSVSATTTTTTTTSRSTRNDAIKYHWVRDIFSTYDTETALPNSPERAGCYDDAHPRLKDILKEQEFERILQLAFNDDSRITVYFYLREKDHRARIVCKKPHRTRSSEYFCMPLNMLEVVRAGSSLQLCRRKHSGKDLTLWAQFKFSTIESMVVFFCSFLALRSQDAGRPIENIQDYELADEEELYGGQIVDDEYGHALRVYQDRISGAVRLQASVHKGPMNRTPVWTAFVTHQLTRRGWLKTLNSRSVAVRDLKLTILMSADDYNPPTTDRGDHILKFNTRDDAEGFKGTMEEIAMNMR
ncbi:hypothetical protein N7454_010000 [Penicillium verhagenii]|nr:hypothetical protein N7454_010000 [Penicillium verhagenii]